MDYKTFASSAEAADEIAKMLARSARPVQLYLPKETNAEPDGNVWVVAVQDSGDVQYLRTDGLVR